MDKEQSHFHSVC